MFLAETPCRHFYEKSVHDSKLFRNYATIELSAGKILKALHSYAFSPYLCKLFKRRLMNSKREFEIPFVGLQPGIHKFEYHIADKFFEAYQPQEFNNCQAIIKLSLDKKSGFMLLKFEIGGNIEVACDRCGSNLPMELWDEFNIVVKLVEDPDAMNETEEDPDVYYIPRGESHLYLTQWIFDFINLSIPMQKMCKAIGGPHCNKEVLEMLDKLNADNQKDANPVWKGLEKFKNLDS